MSSTKQSSQPVEKPVKKCDSMLGLFARIFWMLWGNVVLLASILIILQHKDKAFHVADAVFWITAGALILARYLDVKFWNGLTFAGEPASMKHWQRYAVILLIGSTIAWVLSHVIKYL